MKIQTRLQYSSWLVYACLTATMLTPILAGCSLLGGEHESPTIYAPDPRIVADPSWPTVTWQLVLSSPTATRAIDSFRISVRPTPNELQVYKGASWAKTPSDMLEDTLLRAFEDSGRLQAVARQGTGIHADYKLVLDIRRFEADYAANAVPSAIIEVNAKLIHTKDQTIVASRTFLHAEPSKTADVAEISAAFGGALGQLTKQIVAWTLITGNAYEGTAHSESSNEKRMQ